MRLMKDIREALRTLSGTQSHAPGNLGVAFTAGKHQRAPLARAIRRKRARKFRDRVGRLAVLKISRRAKVRIFKS
eukprot:8228497-Pyramimonas_sp.AAC.1